MMTMNFGPLLRKKGGPRGVWREGFSSFTGDIPLFTPYLFSNSSLPSPTSQHPRQLVF